LRNEDLLLPTLSDRQSTPALYGSTGFFLSAFFGGPLGAVIYGGCNSHRLQRLQKDAPVLLLIVAAAYLLPYVLYQQGWLQQLVAMAGGATRNYGIILRALGLLTFGAIYLMHRDFFRASRVGGSAGLPGWRPGIAAVLMGIWANAAFVQWLLKHH
jgi:hypothetical protein